MYANSLTNVRSGPSASYSKISSLNLGSQVTITGKASNGWYEITLDGKKGYVSSTLLQSTKPQAKATTTKTASQAPVPSTCKKYPVWTGDLSKCPDPHHYLAPALAPNSTHISWDNVTVYDRLLGIANWQESITGKKDSPCPLYSKFMGKPVQYQKDGKQYYDLKLVQEVVRLADGPQ